VSIVRSIKVISIICAGLSIFFNGLSIAASAWLKSGDYQEGLWQRCDYIAEDYVTCREGTLREWIEGCRALVIISLVMSFVGLVVTSVGVQSTNFRMKYRYYTISLLILFAAAVPEIVALILFPVKFVDELTSEASWGVGYAYCLGWISAICNLIGGILLYIDRNTDEAMDREKTTCYLNESIEEGSFD